MISLYIVHRIRGGYAREDQPQSDAVGVYTDPELARKVAVVTGGRYEEMILDYVPPGIQAHAQELGMDLKTSSPNSELREIYEQLKKKYGWRRAGPSDIPG